MKQKPNILFILTDDQGYWSLGCYGNKEIHTPNLDRLAADGMRFDNFFCASPVCSPARASILTGAIPSQHGVHDWILKGHTDETQLDPELRKQLYNPDATKEYNHAKGQLKGDQAINYLDGQTCYTDLLSADGYYCGLSGKWHLGNSGNPQAGFSYWKTIAMGGDNYYHPTVLQDGAFRMLHKTYLTDYITDNALHFLEEARHMENPFYLSVHYTAPHSPWGKGQHPEHTYSLYEDCPFISVPDLPAHPWNIYQKKTPEQFAQFRKDSLKGYYAAITAMDENIGRLLDYLDCHNLRDNTLIFFTSDNGMNMGHHGIIGKGNGTNPLNMYEPSVRVPAIVSWPGHIPAGSICDDLLSHYDIFPTLTELLDLASTHSTGDTRRLPGRSFAPLLNGGSLNAEASIFIYDEYGPVRMVRTKEWKYIHRYPDGPHELYHLAEDPDETQNLIHQPEYAPIIEKLRRSLQNWFDCYVDPNRDGSGLPVTGLGQTGYDSFAPFTPYD